MHGRAEIVSDLLRRANLSSPDLLVADVAAALVQAGGAHLVLWVVDYEQESLRSVGVASSWPEEVGEEISLVGTMAGRCFRSQAVLSGQGPQGWRVWAPVRERAEEIGVVEFGFGELSDEILRLCEDLGRLIGHLVRTSDRYTDLIRLKRRSKPMALAAELQWDMLLPPLAFSAPSVVVAGKLEPAYEVGGDGFDYSLDDEVLHFVFLDAMGHSLASALASALALASARHGRRQGLGLVETAHGIDMAMQGQFGGDIFVTGHIGCLDARSGELTWINAGHPDPLVARAGKVVGGLHAEPCKPFGLGIEVSEVGHRTLEPDDRLLFYSDGVIEARPSGGGPFGMDRLVEQFQSHLSERLLPGEVLRRIVASVIAHRSGELQDDASVMLVEWHPPPSTSDLRGQTG